jgi:sodium transport system permease protein
MNSLQVLIAIIKKEILELIRDQRSLIATFAYAMLGPVLLYVVIKSTLDDHETDIKVTVGIEYQTSMNDEIQFIEDFLRSSNIQTLRVGKDQSQDFIQSETTQSLSQHFGFDVLIQLSNVVNQSKPVHQQVTYTVKVIGNDSRTTSSENLKHIASLMQEFSQLNQSNSMLKQGLRPQHPQWKIQSHVVNSHSADSARLLDSLLIFILLAPFIITLNYINDATAGERERNSLVPMLIQPINPMLLITAKWFVGSLLGIIGTGITMILGFSLLKGLPLHELNITLDTSPAALLTNLGLLVPLVLLVAAMQMLIALAAKSYKEGQSYLTLFSFLPMIVVFMAHRLENIEWIWSVPIIGQQSTLQAAVNAQSINFNQFAVQSVVCLVLTVMIFFAVNKQLTSESVVNGR